MFHLIDHLLPKPQNETVLESAALPMIELSSPPPSPCLASEASTHFAAPSYDEEGGRLCRALLYAVLLALLLAAAGCAGKKRTARDVPPAPSLPANPTLTPPPDKQPTSPGIHVDPHSPVLWSQVGYASWYGPNYNNKKAANGEIYNQNEMTAAHNTLPMNSIVRVVNLKNNQSAVVRITDRGPFVGDRIIDLSMAAAKAVSVYLPGTAQVRLDVLQAPRPIETGGRWCVQIGAFETQSAALQLKTKLLYRYPDAQVLQFKGPTGYWVRIRVPQDDKDKTREVYQHTHVQEGAAFMVRLD